MHVCDCKCIIMSLVDLSPPLFLQRVPNRNLQRQEGNQRLFGTQCFLTTSWKKFAITSSSSLEISIFRFFPPQTSKYNRFPDLFVSGCGLSCMCFFKHYPQMRFGETDHLAPAFLGGVPSPLFFPVIHCSRLLLLISKEAAEL